MPVQREMGQKTFSASLGSALGQRNCSSGRQGRSRPLCSGVDANCREPFLDLDLALDSRFDLDFNTAFLTEPARPHWIAIK